MARIRTIKPEFWSHEALSALPEATHLLAASLLNYSDDEGYFNANPGLVKAACSPLRNPTVTIQESLSMLAVIEYIQIGTTASGRILGRVVSFQTHQTISHPKESKIKTLDITWQESSNVPGLFRDQSILNREQGTGKWNREQGTGHCGLTATTSDENGSADKQPTAATSPPASEPTETSEPTASGYPISFESFWEAYPRRGGRRRGKRKTFSMWKSVRAADRQAVVQAATKYAASSEVSRGFARDPERFLSSEWWREWLEDEVQVAPASKVMTPEEMTKWNAVDGGPAQ